MIQGQILILRLEILLDCNEPPSIYQMLLYNSRDLWHHNPYIHVIQVFRNNDIIDYELELVWVLKLNTDVHSLSSVWYRNHQYFFKKLWIEILKSDTWKKQKETDKKSDNPVSYFSLITFFWGLCSRKEIHVISGWKKIIQVENHR